MGWDIVAIGTNHKLPIESPVETAKKLTPITIGPISIGYYLKWHYDAKTNNVCIPDGMYQWKELTLINPDCPGDKSLFDIENEAARRVFAEIQSIEQVGFTCEDDKAMFISDVFDEPYFLYENDTLTGKYLGIRIFKEIVEFSEKFPGMWFSLTDVFYEPYIGENKRILDEFRKDIYAQLTACGCDKAYYFPDQGSGERIWNKINRPADEWLSFLLSRSYLDEDDPDQLIFNIQEYIKEGRILKDEGIICLVDDFSDFKN